MEVLRPWSTPNMLPRSWKRALYLVGPTVFVVLLCAHLYSPQSVFSRFRAKNGASEEIEPSGKTTWTESTRNSAIPDETHHEVFSVSTTDKKFFELDFGDYLAINPNIVPHPHLNETWIMVGQLQPRADAIDGVKHVWCAQLSCTARFKTSSDGTTRLSCIKGPLALPIPATYDTKCTENLLFLTRNIGPHDGRVFYGPDNPYTVYGSNSHFTCFGQFIQDFRPLVDWGYEKFDVSKFWHQTEIQRPTRSLYNQIEKNWFIFWDAKGSMYVHYDMAPKRSFAKLSWNGAATGSDLAPTTAKNDKECMRQFLPALSIDLESMHQATNSLSISLCARSDPDCSQKEANTHILTVIHHKTFYQFHAVYEPYVVLFKSAAPFQIYGISKKPIWISGRGGLGKGNLTETLINDPEKVKSAEGYRKPTNQTEMLYVTSMSWKQQGQKYHGYLDDILFLPFGREDTTSAVIDIRAGDLLEGLGLCEELS